MKHVCGNYLIDVILWGVRKSNEEKQVIWKNTSGVTLSMDLEIKYYKSSFTADRIRNIKCCFLSNVSIRIINTCRFQLYVEIHSATCSLQKMSLLSHFYVNPQKIQTESSLKMLKIPTEFKCSTARYTKNLFFSLSFRT